MAVATRKQYAALIKELLPPGAAWPRDDASSPMALVIEEIAAVCEALDAQACALVEESDPETCAQSFTDWETDWGLPDECALAFGDEMSLDRRRAMLVFKASLEGGQSAAFFQRVAALLGRRVTVEDMRQEDDPDTYHKWRVVVADPGSVSDDGYLRTLAPTESTIDEGHIVNVTASDAVWDSGTFSEQDIGGMYEASVQMGANEPLSTWGDSLLECVIRRLAPAHTTVYFAYP